jgi:hypothetical protein
MSYHFIQLAPSQKCHNCHRCITVRYPPNHSNIPDSALKMREKEKQRKYADLCCNQKIEFKGFIFEIDVSPRMWTTSSRFVAKRSPISVVLTILHSNINGPPGSRRLFNEPTATSRITDIVSDHCMTNQYCSVCRWRCTAENPVSAIQRQLFFHLDTWSSNVPFDHYRSMELSTSLSQLLQ